MIIPQRFFTHGQNTQGDRHVYASRTRFIPNGLLGLFGVHSAMASVTAKRKCPDLIFVKPRFDVYKAVSLQIRAIFAEYTPVIEPLSLDEAYLDVTKNLKEIGTAMHIAEEIRGKIRTGTGLTASAGAIAE